MSFLGIGATLLSGILGRNAERKAVAEQNAYNDPAAIRARAEAAGFNPLLFVGPGVGQQTSLASSNYMGQAISDAGLLAAEKLGQSRQRQQLNRALDENRRLNQELTRQTIRPKVSGIYAGGQTVPSRAVALGGQNADARTSGASFGNGPRARSGPAVPISADISDPNTGKLNGIWANGVFTPMPSGYSTGDQIETVLGDTFAAEVAVQPLAWRMAGDMFHGQTMRLFEERINKHGVGRGLPPRGGNFGNIALFGRSGVNSKYLPALNVPRGKRGPFGIGSLQIPYGSEGFAHITGRKPDSLGFGLGRFARPASF